MAENRPVPRLARRLLKGGQSFSPSKVQPMTTRSATRRSKLDNAIIASLAAMAAMNLFVLTQQFQPAPAFAAAQASEAHAA
jgi:hypothetical protein